MFEGLWWPIGSHYGSPLFHAGLTLVCKGGCKGVGKEVGRRSILYATRIKRGAGIRTEILLENGNPLPRGCFWMFE